MTHKMGLGLGAHADRLCLVRDGASTSYGELARFSDALVDHMRSHAVQRALVQSDDPVDVIRALDAVRNKPRASRVPSPSTASVELS